LKALVPIWKKENWSDGTCEWVHPGLDGTAGAEPPAGPASLEAPQPRSAVLAAESFLKPGSHA
jgi:hypothetical protein